MLALALYKDHSIEDYERLEHPVQGAILQTIADFAGMEPQTVIIAVDGCGAPAFALPLRRAALAYARLVDPRDFPPLRREACRRVVQAMRSHPEMVGGSTGRLETELMRLKPNTLVAKAGAEGYFAIGVLQDERGVGIATNESEKMYLLSTWLKGEERGLQRFSTLGSGAQDNPDHHSDSDPPMHSDLLLREIASFGASLVGFADIRESAPWPRAISIALALDPVILKGVKNGPTPEYYKEYLRANTTLNEIAQRTARLLLEAGYRAEAFPATIADSDPEYERALRAAFQHKTAATRAGLGFIGKSGLLITPEFGPRVRLVTVFTDLPFPTGQPILEGRCGGCRLCIQACPVGAIKGREWRGGMAREELLDAHACRREATRLLEERVGADEAVCGICVAICPCGQRVSTSIEKDS